MAAFGKVKFAFGILVGLVISAYILNSIKISNNSMGGNLPSRLRTVYEGIVLMSAQRNQKDCYLYCYKPRTINATGRMFDPSIPRKTPSHFIDLHNYDVTNFTIVTGADWSHFIESFDAVAGFQELFPGNKIIYYDFGLHPDQVTVLRDWCNVEYRVFNYDKYPPHVRELTNYAFKGILFYEMVQEMEAIFWIDSSIRPKHTNISKWTEVFDVSKRSGVVLFDRTGTRIYNFTHPGVYTYLPADTNQLMEMEMLGAGAIFLYRTEKVFWEVVHWNYLCAMTPDCITPSNHTSHCNVAKPPLSFCHRYDQSSIAVLLVNFAAYNKSLYQGPSNFVAVRRYPTDTFNLKTCRY